MCDQTEVKYSEGEIVWVKLGCCWWPGEARDVDKLPEEVLQDFRRKPIAAVQFFGEDKFEYVKNLSQICLYNCRRKNEYIKKGLDMFRAKQKEGSSFMDKFPLDVQTAEEKSGGNPDIIQDKMFAPEEKLDYKNIFGSATKSKSLEKHKTGGKRGRSKSIPVSISSPSKKSIASPYDPDKPRRKLTHPRLLQVYNGGELDHKFHIRNQPSAEKKDDTQSPEGTPYKCTSCNFSTARLNVIVCHYKYCHNGKVMSGDHESKTNSSGRGKYTKSAPPNGTKPPKRRGRPRKILTESPTIKDQKPSNTQVDTPKSTRKKSPIKEDTKGSPDKLPEKPKPTVNKEIQANKLTDTKQKRLPIMGKRKTPKPGEKAAKKRRPNEEIREKLLADWDDDVDPEEEQKEIELFNKELSSKSFSHSPEKSSNKEEKVNHSSSKVKQTDCFDFDEREDSILNTELEERAKKFAENKKYCRFIDDKGDSLKHREVTSKVLQGAIQKEDQEIVPQQEKKAAEIEELKKSFEFVMAETAVPVLPSVPKDKFPATVGAVPDCNTKSMVVDSHGNDGVLKCLEEAVINSSKTPKKTEPARQNSSSFLMNDDFEIQRDDVEEETVTKSESQTDKMLTFHEDPPYELPLKSDKEASELEENDSSQCSSNVISQSTSVFGNDTQNLTVDHSSESVKSQILPIVTTQYIEEHSPNGNGLSAVSAEFDMPAGQEFPRMSYSSENKEGLYNENFVGIPALSDPTLTINENCEEEVSENDIAPNIAKEPKSSKSDESVKNKRKALEEETRASHYSLNDKKDICSRETENEIILNEKILSNNTDLKLSQSDSSNQGDNLKLLEETFEDSSDGEININKSAKYAEKSHVSTLPIESANSISEKNFLMKERLISSDDNSIVANLTFTEKSLILENVAESNKSLCSFDSIFEKRNDCASASRSEDVKNVSTLKSSYMLPIDSVDHFSSEVNTQYSPSESQIEHEVKDASSVCNSAKDRSEDCSSSIKHTSNMDELEIPEAISESEITDIHTEIELSMDNTSDVIEEIDFHESKCPNLHVVEDCKSKEALKQLNVTHSSTSLNSEKCINNAIDQKQELVESVQKSAKINEPCGFDSFSIDFEFSSDKSKETSNSSVISDILSNSKSTNLEQTRLLETTVDSVETSLSTCTTNQDSPGEIIQPSSSDDCRSEMPSVISSEELLLNCKSSNNAKQNNSSDKSVGKSVSMHLPEFLINATTVSTDIKSEPYSTESTAVVSTESDNPIKVSSVPEALSVSVAGGIDLNAIQSVPGNFLDDEMELDINSMPVVMTDAVIKDQPEIKGSFQVSDFAIVQTSSNDSVIQNILEVDGSKKKNQSDNSHTLPKKSIVSQAQASNKLVKLMKSNAKSVTSTGTKSVAVSNIKSIIPQNQSGGSKYVIIQPSPNNQQIRYASGKGVQQSIMLKAVGQTGQQQTGTTKKLVIVKSPVSVHSDVSTGLIQPQAIITNTGKISHTAQRLVSSSGTIVTTLPAKGSGTKLVKSVNQQPMKLLSGPKIGAKLMMQSTQAKISLPSMQTISKTPIKIIGTTRPKGNTILIQSPQSSSGIRTVAASNAQSQSNLPVGQTITKIATSRNKTSQGSAVQKVIVNTGGTLQSSPGTSRVTQQKTILQKIPTSSGLKSGQVVQIRQGNIIPNFPVVQKANQTVNVKSNVTQRGLTQTKGKLVSLKTNKQTTVSSSNETKVPALQTIKPNISGSSSVQSTMQSEIIIPATQNRSATTGGITNLHSIPLNSNSTCSGPSLISTDRVAQVVASSVNTVTDPNQPTYLLVIDENQQLLNYGSTGQGSEAAPRTLYIDSSSINASTDLEKIILAINNQTAASGNVLNLGQNNVQLNTVSSGYSGTTNIQPKGGQDILAAALADTDVFQPEIAGQDSTINTTVGSVMGSCLLDQSTIIPTSSMLVQSLHTNSTNAVLSLKQPIMTPLEVPSSVTAVQPPPPPVTSLDIPVSITESTMCIPSSSYPSVSGLQSENADISGNESSVSSSQTVFQPSMPLLTEDIAESHTPCNNQLNNQNTSVIPASTSENRAQNTSQVTIDSSDIGQACYLEDREHDASMKIVGISYAQVPEISSHESEALSVELSIKPRCLAATDVPESTTETVLKKGEEKLQVGVQSDHSVSTSHLQLGKLRNRSPSDGIDSSLTQSSNGEMFLYTQGVENSSEALAIHNSISNTSAKLPPTESSIGLPFDHVESTSEHSSSDLGLPVSTTNVNEQLCESDTQNNLLYKNANQCYSQIDIGSSETPESTSSLGKTSLFCKNAHDKHSHPTEVPESTSITSVIVQNERNSEDNILSDPLKLKILLDQEVPESSSDAISHQFEENISVSKSFEGDLVTCTQLPESTSSSADLTFTDSPTEAAESSSQHPSLHSMPLLSDENSCVERTAIIGSSSGLKRCLNQDDSRCSDVESSKRSKAEDTRMEAENEFSAKPSGSSDYNDNTDNEDDEFPPAFPTQSTPEKKDYERGDIVWMKVGKVHYPGVVLYTSKKDRLAKVKVVNSPRKDKCFRRKFSQLIHFKDCDKNMELLDQGKKNDQNIEAAYDKVVQYLAVKYFQPNVSAVRYLTFDQDDDIMYGIRRNSDFDNCNYSSLSEQSANYISSKLETSDNHAIKNIELSVETDSPTSEREPEKFSMSDCLPKPTNQEIEEKLNEIKLITEEIERPSCRRYLCNIYLGKIKCTRHDLFVSNKSKQLFEIAGVGPFASSSQIGDIIDLLWKYMQRAKEIKQMDFVDHDYISLVWFPEAIIYALKNIYHVDYQEADKRFSERSYQLW